MKLRPGSGRITRWWSRYSLDVRELLVVGGLVLGDVEVGEPDQLARAVVIVVDHSAMLVRPGSYAASTDLAPFLPGPDLLADAALGRAIAGLTGPRHGHFKDRETREANHDSILNLFSKV